MLPSYKWFVLEWYLMSCCNINRDIRDHFGVYLLNTTINNLYGLYGSLWNGIVRLIIIKIKTYKTILECAF